MGRISLPSITKLEDVLNLLLDPAKYQKYLVEFKAVYDQAQGVLGQIQTVEQANTYLANAIDAKEQAAKDIAALNQQAREHLIAAKADRDKAVEEKQQIVRDHREVEQLRSNLKQDTSRFKNDVLFFEKKTLDENQLQESRSKSLDLRHEKLTIAEKALEARLAKIAEATR